MISTKNILLGLSGLGVTAGGVSAWWFIKEINDNKKLETIGKTILEKCGGYLKGWWYTEDWYIVQNYVNSQGERVNDNKNADKTKGYYKKNDKGMNADEYESCLENLNNHS